MKNQPQPAQTMTDNSKSINKSLAPAVIMGVSVIVAVWLYTERTRFLMIPSGDRAYKYDRVTGETWLIVDSRYGPVDGPVIFAD